MVCPPCFLRGEATKELDWLSAKLPSNKRQGMRANGTTFYAWSPTICIGTMGAHIFFSFRLYHFTLGLLLMRL